MLKNKEALCIFTRILGGKTFSTLLESAIREIPNINVSTLNFEESDYGVAPTPKYLTLSSITNSSFAIKYKVRTAKLNLDDYDFLLFQSYHLAAPFKSEILKKPTLIALDSTPQLANAGRLKASPLRKLIKSALIKIFDVTLFNPIFKNTDVFLARTQQVKDSLVNTYNVSPDRILVTYIPTITSRPVRKPPHEKHKLLFVGNDFKRKGGPFIVTVFNQFLAGKAELIIVSTDSCAPSYACKDIKVINGMPRDELLELYKECSIFLFPSWHDELGLALCEAISAGMAIISRDITAQHEIVQTGFNGALLPYNSNEKDWGLAVLKLLDSPEAIEKYRMHSYQKADLLLSNNKFQDNVNQAINKLEGRPENSKRN